MRKRNLKWGGVAALVAASMFLTGTAHAATVIQPAGLWTESTQTFAPTLTAKTVWYKVGSTYVGETALDSQYNGWAGELFTTTNHTKVNTTQHFTGLGTGTWVCFNHGRSGINSLFACINPADY